MSNTLLASYVGVPYVWKLRFNPQLNTKHANTIHLPLRKINDAAYVNMIIDWGDGTKTFIDTTSPSDDFKHTYAVSIDDVVVTMSSTTWQEFLYVSDIYKNNIIRTEYYDETLIAVENAMPNIGFTYVGSPYTAIFLDCKNLKTVSSDVFYNLTDIENFESCFNGCTSLEEIPAGLFDKNTVCTDFRYCFANCSSIVEIPAGLFDNNPLVTTFSNCFSYCRKLANIPSGLFDNNPLATNFATCFSNCTALTEIPAGLFDNNTLATGFMQCFANCSNLVHIPEGLFDNNNEVTIFSGCFLWCRKLTNIPSGLFAKNTKVTAFYQCFFQPLEEGTTLTIGSALVDNAVDFAEDITVVVPENSTTYDTFSVVASTLNLTVQTF